MKFIDLYLEAVTHKKHHLFSDHFDVQGRKPSVVGDRLFLVDVLMDYTLVTDNRKVPRVETVRQSVWLSHRRKPDKLFPTDLAIRSRKWKLKA